MLRSLLLASATLALAAQTPAPAPVPATPAPEAAPAVKVDKVLATLGSETVKESDFDLFLSVSLPEQQRKQIMIMPGAKDQYLKRYLDYRILAAKAEKDGIGSGPDFAKKMKLMEMQVLVQTLFERDGQALKEKSVVKDEDVKAYFDKHPEKFISTESFSARHILVSTKPQGKEKPRTDEEALARLKKIQAALKAGKTFDELAKTYSDDPGSKDKGGLYENMPFGRFVPEFDKAVRTQDAGKVGKPVKTTFGYHLIKVEKVNPAMPQTFEAAKEAARQQATTERQEAVMTGYMEEAKAATGYHEVVEAPQAPKSQEGAK
jgi:parvulin-like peptidyl-prolyl isomerase